MEKQADAAKQQSNKKSSRSLLAKQQEGFLRPRIKYVWIPCIAIFIYTDPMYNKPLIITEPISSNAFNYDKRPNPKITVPTVIEGSLEDVQIGNEITFEDYDEYNQLQSCKGLKHLVKFDHPKTGKPIVVVDNHNHVFWFWYEAWHQKKIDRGITLVHIDAHRDTRHPERNLTDEEAEDLQKVFKYTNSVLNVGNYIPPARAEGLIGDLISITSQQELEEAKPRAPFLLNIDLDFWAPEMDYIPENLSLEIIRPWILKAEMITFATSPFFIDQERAIEMLRKLLALPSLK